MALWAIIKRNNVRLAANTGSDLPFLRREDGHGERGEVVRVSGSRKAEFISAYNKHLINIVQPTKNTTAICLHGCQPCKQRAKELAWCISFKCNLPQNSPKLYRRGKRLHSLLCGGMRGRDGTYGRWKWSWEDIARRGGSTEPGESRGEAMGIGRVAGIVREPFRGLSATRFQLSDF